MRPLIRATAAVLWLALAAAASAQGITVAIGGALKDDNAEVWGALVRLAGGPGARYAVLATAAGDPDRSAAAIVSNLQRHGARAEHVRVAPRIAELEGTDLRAAVADERWLALVRGADGVYLSGGAQARLMDTLQPGGRSTPLLDAIRALHSRGGVVAGTSSGAAVLSALAFRDAGDLIGALAGTLRDGIEVDRGFGFLPAEVVVDQHFLKRGRIGRLLPLLLSRRLGTGLGVEENSAAVVRGADVEAIGGRGVLVVDASAARSDPARGAFNVQGVSLSLLTPGDRWDLERRRFTPSPLKTHTLDPGTPGFTGYFEGRVFYPDMLGDGAIATAMARLVDSADPEVRGLAFDTAAPGPEQAARPGFTWRLYKGPATRAYTTRALDDYSIAEVLLDVQPVTMAQPLHVPYIPAPPPQPAQAQAQAQSQPQPAIRTP